MYTTVMSKNIILFLVFIININLHLFAGDQNYNILFINSYHTGFTWSDEIEQAFIHEIEESGLDINIFFERMDSKRFTLEQITPVIYNNLKDKYTPDYFDLIVTSDDNAMEFIYRYREELFPGIPIVFCGVNNEDSPILDSPQLMTGIMEFVDIEALLELIIAVHPKLKHLALISDSTNSGNIHMENTKKIITELYPKLSYSEHQNWTLDELSRNLKLLPPNTVIIELAFHLDKEGHLLSFSDERDFLKYETHFPAYSLWDSRLNYGILGGIMSTGEVQGVEAARLALVLLSGSKIDELPIKKEIDLPIYYDYSEMERFGVVESQIPDDAIVINYPDTFWFRYREYLIAIILFILFLGFLIVLLISNIIKRRQSEKTLSSINSALERSLEERTTAITTALKDLRETQHQLVESRKMSALTGMVTGIANRIQNPLDVCHTASTLVKDSLLESKNYSLVETVELIETNVHQINHIVEDFKSVAVELDIEERGEINLKEFLEELLSHFKWGQIRVEINCDEHILLNTFSNSLQRVLSILLDNSIVHGFSDYSIDPKITLGVIKNERSISINVQDNGRGLSTLNRDKVFDPDYTPTLVKGRAGLGLNIAYNEVVHRFLGKIHVDKDYINGLGIIIEIPL